MPSTYEIVLSVLLSDADGGGGMSFHNSDRARAREIATRITRDLTPPKN